MITIKDGNILDAKESIIVHQVNVDGVMGGGVARQLANRYPGLEIKYNLYCQENNNDYSKLKGRVFNAHVKDKAIINIFSQKPNFNTDYEAMKECFKCVKTYAKLTKKSVCMPYKIGCGIANGDWKKVYKIIKNVFSDYDVTLYRLEK